MWIQQFVQPDLDYDVCVSAQTERCSHHQYVILFIKTEPELFLEILTKILKIKSWICPFSQSHAKIEWVAKTKQRRKKRRKNEKTKEERVETNKQNTNEAKLSRLARSPALRGASCSKLLSFKNYRGHFPVGTFNAADLFVSFPRCAPQHNPVSAVCRQLIVALIYM